MLRRKNVLLLALSALCACSGAQEPPQPAAAPPAPPSGPTQASASEEPANTAFIGRVWVSTTPGSPRGSILVFLPNRTLLMDSCFETFRLSEWGVAGAGIRWLEDTVPIEATVETPGKDELTLRIAGQDRVQTYIAASVPYVCPDMPR
jgi:hypothetical protein